MAQDYDVIITGLGAMGSAAAYHLSLAGARVLGLDRFHPPHDQGSSHGRTRIIREAYFEHPLYVPLVQRAYELWGRLEQAAGRSLLQQTGGLMIGTRDGAIVRGALRSAEEHRLAHELLDAEALHARFPALHPDPAMVAVWEPRAGILFPELAIQSHIELAAKMGASFRFNEPVLTWSAGRGRVQVHTSSGSYQANRLLLSSGAWLTSLLPKLELPLAVERQVLFWFAARQNQAFFEPARCPIHIWEYAPGRFFYGFPDLRDGIKVAFHHEGEHAAPDRVRRDVSSEEVQTMREILQRFIPDAAGELISTAVCLYTNTPDEHFLLDYHPSHREVLIASPCSGHGFKFSPVIGELAATLLQDRKPVFDLSLFQIDRLRPGQSRA